MSEEEANTIREANEKVREERQKLADAITNRVGKFKKDLMGSPIRKAMLEAKENKQVSTCCISYRADEKYWIFGSQPGEVYVCYGINFEGVENQALARVMLHEYQAAMRKTQASVSVAYYDKEISAEMKSFLPDLDIKNYSNGVISFSKYIKMVTLTRVFRIRW
jgi:hypothetical protein